jgi:hypothetical protein
MFKISRLQMTEIAKTAVRNHEQRMVRQLTEKFPTGCFGVSKDELVDRIRQGVQRAALRKLSSEKHVGRFVAVATTLGQEFDMDPKFEWADELLAQVTQQNAPKVIEMLSEKAAEHLKGTPGAIAAEAVKALVSAPAPDEEPLSENAEVGDPVTPCPKRAPRRLYSFSS